MGEFPRIGSALAVLDSEGRILLGRRHKDPQRGSWVIPGGGIRSFESIAAAATREVFEETGLRSEVMGPLDAYEVINPPDEHRIVIYSWGRLLGGELRPASDLSAAEFVSLDKVLDLPLSPLVRKVLTEYLTELKIASEVLLRT